MSSPSLDPFDCSPPWLRSIRSSTWDEKTFCSLLDETAILVSQFGYERVTLAMIAARAKCSSETLYRYFPERVSALQGLADRNLHRFVDDCVSQIVLQPARTPMAIMEFVLDALVDAFRTQPGFASLRFGDVLDLGPSDNRNWNLGTLASLIAAEMLRLNPLIRMPSMYSVEFDLNEIEDEVTVMSGRLEVMLTIFDALLVRAFDGNAEGDPEGIWQAAQIVRAYGASF